jgi:hypothetical protein
VLFLASSLSRQRRRERANDLACEPEQFSDSTLPMILLLSWVAKKEAKKATHGRLPDSSSGSLNAAQK